MTEAEQVELEHLRKRTKAQEIMLVNALRLIEVLEAEVDAERRKTWTALSDVVDLRETLDKHIKLLKWLDSISKTKLYVLGDITALLNEDLNWTISNKE